MMQQMPLPLRRRKVIREVRGSAMERATLKT